MMRTLRIAAAMLAVVGLLSTCVTTTSQKIEITGDSLNALSVTFETVSRHMTTQCVAKVYTVQTCTTYRVFGEKFKLAYPVAKSLWSTSTQYEDKGLATAAQTAFDKLSADLAPFLAMMGGK